METSINERLNSTLYSDVINSYVDINSITAQKNIVPGSYKETVVQCTDQTLATLNSAGGQTLFTRFKLTPQVRNATLAQLAQIFFQYVIPKNSLGVILKKFATQHAQESTADNSEQITATDFPQAGDKLKFKLFYDSGFSIASMVQLCLTADAKVSTENFNYQQSLLTLNSLPDLTTENSNCETTLKSLVESSTYRGVGSGLIEVDLNAAATKYGAVINKDISIEGVIDLDRGNPLFHNFPIITRNFSELYIRLYMENFLRELKVVYLNKKPLTSTISSSTLNLQGKKLVTTGAWPTTGTIEATLDSTGTNNKFTDVITGTSTGSNWSLPYQRLPADKADFVILNGQMYKVKLVNLLQNGLNLSAPTAFKQTNPIFTLANIEWKRFEIRKVEFDIEEFEDIKASQAKAGTYKFPVHLFRSKNFDQTNAASSSSNALQTTLNAPNIDRIFITQPLTRDYYTFWPSLAVTDINPQLHNNPVLPRTEDDLNSRTIERICSVFTDTDKYSPSSDLLNSLDVPTINKQLWLKGTDTYGGLAAFEDVQRGYTAQLFDNVMVPNKFVYALELNAGGCFRRGFNSVINGNYSPTVPINLQQSTQTSANIYFDNGVAHGPIIPPAVAPTWTYDTTGQESDIVNNTGGAFNSVVSYGDIRESGAVASVHCLCDYIFWVNFDAYGNMTDFGVSEFNDRN